MASVGTITANLIAKTHGYTRPIQQAQKITVQFTRTMEDASRKIDNMARATSKISRVTGALAVGMVTASIGLANLASDAQETQAKFNIVFGSLAKDSNKWAEEFGSNIGRSITDIKTWSAETQNTLGALGFMRAPAADMSKSLTELAVDVGAFMNAADADVVEDFRSAITGSVKAVRKYGIVINQTTMRDELRRMGIRKSMALVDEQTKVQARYNLIMRATQDAQGAALREAGNYANQVKGLKGDFKNLGEEMGARLLGPGTRIIGWIRSGVKWFKNLDDGVKNNITRWIFFGTALLAGVSVFALVGTGLLKVIQAFTLFGKALGLIANPTVITLALIAAAAYLLYKAWDENWGGIQEKTEYVWGIIEPILSSFWAWLGKSWKWTVEIAKDVWGWIINTTWAEKWTDIKNLFNTIWTWTLNIGESISKWIIDTTWAEKWTDIKGWFSTAWKWTINTAGTAWEWFDKKAPWLTSALSWTGNKLKDAWSWTINIAGTAWEWLKNHDWKEDWDKIKGWMSEGWSWVINIAGDAWEWLGNTKLGQWLEDTRQKIVDSNAWKWTINVAVPAVIEAGEAIIKAVVEISGAMYDAIKKGLATGEWADFWAVSSDVWSKGVLIGVTLSAAVAGFNLVKTAIIGGLGLATSGFGTAGVLGAITIGIQLMEAQTSGDYARFAENLIWSLIAAFAVGGLTGSLQAGVLTFTIAMNLKWNWLNAEQKEIVDDWTAYEQFGKEWNKAVGEKYGNTFWEQAKKMYGLWFGAEKVPKMDSAIFQMWLEERKLMQNDQGFSKLLDAIYKAEGGAGASVPYGMITLNDKSIKYTGEKNQERFEKLAKGLEVGSEEYYRAAALTTVLHYWDSFAKKFPEYAGKTFAEIAPEVQKEFVKYLGKYYAPVESHPLNANWIPNVTKLLGYASGTTWTGHGPLDEVAGVVHKKEAVVPWKFLKKGLPGVLEFFGVPGFEEGKPAALPSGGSGGFDLAEIAKTVGKAVTDALTTGLEKLVGEEMYKKLTTGFETVKGEIQGLIDDFNYLGEQAALLGKELEPEALDWPTYWNNLFTDLGNAMLSQVPALKGAIDAFQAVVSSGGDPVMGLISAIVSVLTSTETFGKIIDSVGKPLIMLFDVMGQAMKPLIPIIDLLGKVIEWLAIVTTEVWNILLEMISKLPFVDLRQYKISLDEARKAADKNNSATDRATEAMRNVPQGLKIVTNRIAAVQGYIKTPQTTAGPLPPPANVSSSAGGITYHIEEKTEVIIEGDVYGINDLELRIEKAVARLKRKNKLATFGVS